jgi:NAD+ diphosphatase
MRRSPEDRSTQLNRSAQNTFTSLAIDRASRRRRDEAWVRERLEDPASRFLLVWESKVLVTDEAPYRPAWLSLEEAREYTQRAESVILLGEGEEGDGGRPGESQGARTYFALGLRASDEPPPAGLAGRGTFRGLRAVAAIADDETAALLAYAKAMVHYHHQHQFCARCGAPVVSEAGGYLLTCSDPQCGQLDFPRIDPAIIVLVSSGKRCLLGRQATWPENLYSVVAGFVEPGESLEGAVAREVWEETGVRVEQVRYHSSQPWPFPRSLMIGFIATAASTSIRLNDGELGNARWLSREEIIREVKQGTLRLSSPISISHRLIETWFDAGGSMRLKDLLKAQ